MVADEYVCLVNLLRSRSDYDVCLLCALQLYIDRKPTVPQGYQSRDLSAELEQVLECGQSLSALSP
jgi:hypothetical protein